MGMETLMLLENPHRGGRGGFNQMYNPYRRHRRARRNPAITGTVREWSQGVDPMDVVGAGAGLVVATIIPGMIIKDSASTINKLLKLGVSALAAFAAGAVGKAAVSTSVGKSAIIGGLAGTATQALAMFAPGVNIGRSTHVGGSTLISPPPNREGEVVSMIQP